MTNDKNDPRRKISDIPPRRRWGDRPLDLGRNEVRCRGEALDPVWWQGRQWAVTAHGIEARDGTYVIKADRIRENMGGEHPWPWPSQVGMKNWTDFEDFTTAWLVALVLHGKEGPAIRKLVAEACYEPQTDDR